MTHKFPHILKWLLPLIAVFLLVGCAQKLKYIEKESFLNDFTIQEEQVIYSCTVTIRNTGKESTTIRISGDFREDQQSGLIREATLSAQDSDGNRSLTVPPGVNTYEVFFVGTHGTSDTRANRNLPPLTLTTVGK